MSHSYSVSPTGTRESSSPCAIERGTAILARRLLGVVQRRDALGKCADVREPLVAVLPPPLVAPPVRRILEEGDPVDVTLEKKCTREVCLYAAPVSQKSCLTSERVMRMGILTRSAHDGYARGDKLVLHILVDVVQESPMSLVHKHQRKDLKKQNEHPHLAESSRLNSSSQANPVSRIRCFHGH